MPILILGEDYSTTTLLAGVLQKAGRRCEVFTRTLPARQALALRQFSLAILDFTVGYDECMALLHQLRRSPGAALSNSKMPVLVLSARTTVGHQVRVLDAGADMFMLKPVELPVVEAAVRALLRRPRRAPDTLVHGDLVIDPRKRVCSIAGFEVELTETEFQVLAAIAAAAPEPVPFSAVTDSSGCVLITAQALQVHVHNLRRKVGKARIKNVRGYGYRLA